MENPGLYFAGFGLGLNFVSLTLNVSSKDSHYLIPINLLGIVLGLLALMGALRGGIH